MTRIERMTARFAVLASVLLVTLAIGASAELVVAAIAAVALATLLGDRAVRTAMRMRFATVGARSRRHAQVLERVPEPSHPDTDGRTRSRAPGLEPAAA
jgi:hypothetical protein